MCDAVTQYHTYIEPLVKKIFMMQEAGRSRQDIQQMLKMRRREGWSIPYMDWPVICPVMVYTAVEAAYLGVLGRQMAVLLTLCMECLLSMLYKFELIFI